LLGELFKDHSATHTRKNLMIFIRPQIMHDGTDMAIETNSKYNAIREEQRQVGAGESKFDVPLLPGVKSPVLPPLPPPPAPGSTPAAPITQQQRDRAAEKAQHDLDSANRDAAVTSSAPAAQVDQK
jgi:general secretion pathway protein D